MSPPKAPSEITRLLAEWNEGDRGVFERLVPIVYDDLRRLAWQQLRGERPGCTLQPTALVNEFYLRLIDHREPDWQNRAHFFGAAAKLMRRIIVDYARKRQAQKRDGHRVAMESVGDVPAPAVSADIEALDEALDRLAEHDLRAAKFVEYHYFLGMTIAEAAEMVGASPATAKRDWDIAKAWLTRQISRR